MTHPPWTRRELLRGGLSLGTLLAAGCEGPVPPLAEDDGPLTDGSFVEVVPFVGEPEIAPGVLEGEGWDARRVYDLSQLGPDLAAAAPGEFFVRTAYPDLLRVSDASWRVGIEGLVQNPLSLDLTDLAAREQPIGEVLLECSGNSINRRFGLMSAASWSGVRIAELLDLIEPSPGATAVRCVGYDDHSVPSEGGHSTPGASWIFPLQRLRDVGWLATGMHDGPLPPEHGAPVRLLMPGWYGCCSIKWVHTLELVDDTAPSTPQMLEFAGRTGQNGQPALASEFLPATMEHSALPVRVERWEVSGETVYRVIGVLWGGSEARSDLVLVSTNTRTGRTQRHPVDTVVPGPEGSWSLFEHLWRPGAGGDRVLAMELEDPAVPTQRLDEGYYARVVALG